MFSYDAALYNIEMISINSIGVLSNVYVVPVPLTLTKRKKDHKKVKNEKNHETNGYREKNRSSDHSET